MSLMPLRSGFTETSACMHRLLPFRSRMRCSACASVSATCAAVSAAAMRGIAALTWATVLAQDAGSDATTDHTIVSRAAADGFDRRSAGTIRNAATVADGPAASAIQTPFMALIRPNASSIAAGTTKNASAVSPTERSGRPTYW